MKQPSFTCDEPTIRRFLDDELDVEQLASFERHLDECDACCQRLSSMTAAREQWSDVESLLSGSDAIGGVDTPIPSRPNISLDFLHPTDDPRMLGRFGGYEIAGVIGVGGMGIVLKGLDQSLNRYVAIKVLTPHYASCVAARKRFAREAQAAAAVVHENVVAIHGVDESESLPYLVMPYVRGESLQKRLDRCGPLSVSEVLRIAMQTALGLAAAHEQGLVHRDIKPANLLLPANVERVLITDFGLARAADDASLTRSGVIAGTPHFMSPEQARGDALDPRSDLFSLGTVMYVMCTGRLPFRAETPLGVLRRLTDEEPRDIRAINSDVPVWMVNLIDRLHSKSPNERFASAQDVADVLTKCIAHVRDPDKHTIPEIIAEPRRSKRPLGRIAWLGVAASVLLVLTAVTMIRPWRSNVSPSPSANPADARATTATEDGVLADGPGPQAPTPDATASEATSPAVNLPTTGRSTDREALDRWDDSLGPVLKHLEASLKRLQADDDEESSE